MSQTDLADRLGVSPQAVSSWVVGRTTPSLRYAKQIETLLGIPIDSWLEQERSPRKRTGTTG